MRQGVNKEICHFFFGIWKFELDMDRFWIDVAQDEEVDQEMRAEQDAATWSGAQMCSWKAKPANTQEEIESRPSHDWGARLRTHLKNFTGWQLFFWNPWAVAGLRFDAFDSRLWRIESQCGSPGKCKCLRHCSTGVKIERWSRVSKHRILVSCGFVDENMFFPQVLFSQLWCLCPPWAFVFHVSPFTSSLVGWGGSGHWPFFPLTICVWILSPGLGPYVGVPPHFVLHLSPVIWPVGREDFGSHPPVSPAYLLAYLLVLAWLGVGSEDFGSYVFVLLSTCLFTRAWTGSFTLGNPGICSALRRSCLAQTLFESQLAQKQAVWKFSEIFVCKVTLLAAYCCIICLHWCFGFEAAWQCACWNGLANLSMLS